ncbi:MAG: hypothetical protein CMI01_09290 [Oceanospirillaceae bacterium]|nr:hypothetical protein [Oceanospirillaceae bacterium]
MRKRLTKAERGGELLLRPLKPGSPESIGSSGDGQSAGVCWLFRQPGQDLRYGYGLPPLEARDSPATLFLKSSDYSLFDVEAPPGIKKSEYPLLLEDLLLGDVSQQQIVCIGEQWGRLQLVVCARPLIDEWQQWALSNGIDLRRILADFQYVPDAEQQTVLWRQGEMLTLVRPVLPDNPGGVLAWPDREPPPLPSGWQAAVELESTSEAEALELLAAQYPSAGTSLLPRQSGDGAWSLGAAWRRLVNELAVLRKPLAWALLAMLGYVVLTWVQAHQAQAYYRESLAQRLGHRAALPLERVRRQLMQQLHDRQEPLLELADSEDRYLRVEKWLRQNPGWQVDRLARTEAGEHLRLSWRGAGTAPELNQLQQAWDEQVGGLRWRQSVDDGPAVYTLSRGETADRPESGQK